MEVDSSLPVGVDDVGGRCWWTILEDDVGILRASSRLEVACHLHSSLET